MLTEHAEPGFERLLEIDDPITGLRGFVALHSLQRGPAFGGIRRRAYASLADARADALKLAEAMSLKCALAGLPAGGGKTVLLANDAMDLDAAYARLGEIVEGLGGAYVCGPDVGTSTSLLDAVRRNTRHVNPLGNDAGASTAAGVLAGARATLRALTGSESVAGLRVAIEGLGAVGGALARSMLAAGADLWGADPDEAARKRLAPLNPSSEASRLGLFQDSAALDLLHVDLLMPCALGASVGAGRAHSHVARAICGSANNQLAAPELDLALHQAGVLWAPDIAVSAGAVIEGVHSYLAQQAGEQAGGQAGGQARRAIAADIAAIGQRMSEIYAESRARDRATGAVARQMASARLG